MYQKKWRRFSKKWSGWNIFTLWGKPETKTNKQTNKQQQQKQRQYRKRPIPLMNIDAKHNKIVTSQIWKYIKSIIYHDEMNERMVQYLQNNQSNTLK